MQRLNQFIPEAAKWLLVHRYRRWHQKSRMMTVIFINLDFKLFRHVVKKCCWNVLDRVSDNLAQLTGV